MTLCPVCRLDVLETEARTVASGGHVLLVHATCFDDFSSMVREAIKVSNITPPSTGLDRLAKSVDGRLVLVHRNFRNEQMPFLVYLSRQNDPVSIVDMYKWATENELRIGNPANQVIRLKEKGHIATYDRNGERYAVITEAGRKAIEEYAASLG